MFLTNTQTALLRVIYPERYGRDGVRELAEEETHRHFDLLDRALDGRKWLAADDRTGADLFLLMLTRWGRRLDPAAWDRPRLREHFARAAALPGVRRMVAEQELELPAWTGSA